MNMKKLIALVTALCLLAGCLCGALAEEQEQKEDVIEDLLYYFLGINDDPNDPDEEPAGEDVGDEYVEGEEEYVFDDEDDTYYAVQDHVVVNDLSITEGLDPDWLNILLLGSDARGDTKFLRTDTMIVLSINSKTNEAKMTSIMRDIYVELPEYGKQRLNAACVYGGPELTMKTINEYFHLNLQQYVLVNMKCLVEIVDALGGIRLDVSKAESAAVRRLSQEDAVSPNGERKFAVSVPAGEQVLLNGKQVLAYSRIRKSDSDYARTERQRKVLLTIAKRLQEESLFSLASIVTNMLQYVVTNLGFQEIMSIAGVCMKLDLSSVSEFRIPADDTFESGMYGTTWLIKPDFEANAELLHEFIYG